MDSLHVCSVCVAAASRLCTRREEGEKGSFNQEIHSTFLTPLCFLLLSLHSKLVWKQKC